MTVSSAVAKNDEKTNALANLNREIKAREPQFALALPKHVTPDRFVRAALTAINVVPRLAECTQSSIIAGLMQAAQLGLEVADVRGQAYLIPRKDNKAGGVYKASFQLGYRGMIDLAARSGITVDVDEICENDAYDYERGTAPKLYHKPTLGKRGEAIAYYAVAHFSDGRPPQFVILGRGEVEEHRDKFGSDRDYNTKEIKGTWVDHFDAMARKTAVRQLLNYLPVSVELRQAVAIEATASDDPPLNVSFIPPAALDRPDNVDADGVVEPDAIEATVSEAS